MCLQVSALCKGLLLKHGEKCPKNVLKKNGLKKKNGSGTAGEERSPSKDLKYNGRTQRTKVS